jgi:hypothetical protein
VAPFSLAPEQPEAEVESVAPAHKPEPPASLVREQEPTPILAGEAGE